MQFTQQRDLVFDRRTLLRASGGTAGILWLGLPRPSWGQLPESDEGWIVHTRSIPNREPTLDRLVQSWVTPTEHFYVRSHAPTPTIDADRFRLQVEGLVDEPFSISLKELRERFPKQRVTATLICAGNRREEHSEVKPVDGVPWGAGAIGNARWGGVWLADLLGKAGVKESARHVWFEGADQIEREDGVIPFGGSIPLAKAMQENRPAAQPMVAYEMNRQELTPDHGYPMRMVVPGFIGARSVKWLRRIVVSDRPSPNHYLASAYKLVTEGTDQEWKDAEPIQPFPLNSAIAVPEKDARVEPGRLTVRGYAVARGLPGLTVAKVELSSDGGKTWSSATFSDPARPFCWRLWEARTDITQMTENLIVRATDSDGHVQPASVDWNLKGYLYNAWHRKPIRVQ